VKVGLRATRLVIAATAAAVATLLVGSAPATLATPPPPPATNPLQRQLEAAASGTGALVHMRKLQRIADQNGGNRASPGPGYDASVDYVVGVLRKAGWQVSTPEFDVDGDRIRNVIAHTKTGDPAHVVMAGAHLDSVEDGPGMNDNASGSAALLEIAVLMGGAAEVTNQVRMAWWGAEEIDFNGSTHYVETLSGADRRKIALYLNLDIVASPNVTYMVEGGVGRGDDTGPDGSAEVARVLAERLAATGVTPERMVYEYGSDYIPFIEAGIPAAGGVHRRRRGENPQASRPLGRPSRRRVRSLLPRIMRQAGQHQREGAGPVHTRGRGDHRPLRNIGLGSSRPMTN
jgi:aminopeptidase S